MSPITVIHGNAPDELAKLPDKSVHMIVTSPPYDDLRTYGGHKFDFEAIAIQLSRVLVKGGVCCWIVGDGVIKRSETLTSCRQKIFFHDKCGLLVHDTMIYKKRNFSHPEKTRYHQTFEYIFVFSKGPPKTFNPIRDRKNITAGCVGNLGINTLTERDGSKSVRSKKINASFGMRHNVWEGNTRGQEEMCIALKHPAMMPKWLARDLILSFSNPGDVILDPMAGSGTVGQEALALERKSILIEANQAYLPLIQKRTSNLTPGLAL